MVSLIRAHQRGQDWPPPDGSRKKVQRLWAIETRFWSPWMPITIPPTSSMAIKAQIILVSGMRSKPLMTDVCSTGTSVVVWLASGPKPGTCWHWVFNRFYSVTSWACLLYSSFLKLMCNRTGSIWSARTNSNSGWAIRKSARDVRKPSGRP